MSWITFNDEGPSPSGKTRIWQVYPKEGIMLPLGKISWYALWRKYVFLPYQNTVFEKDCLRDIADFCESKTIEHKTAKCS